MVKLIEPFFWKQTGLCMDSCAHVVPPSNHSVKWSVFATQKHIWWVWDLFDCTFGHTMKVFFFKLSTILHCLPPAQNHFFWEMSRSQSSYGGKLSGRATSVATSWGLHLPLRRWAVLPRRSGASLGLGRDCQSHSHQKTGTSTRFVFVPQRAGGTQPCFRPFSLSEAGNPDQGRWRMVSLMLWCRWACIFRLGLRLVTWVLLLFLADLQGNVPLRGITYYKNIEKQVLCCETGLKLLQWFSRLSGFWNDKALFQHPAVAAWEGLGGWTERQRWEMGAGRMAGCCF